MYADVAYATVQLIGGDADIDDGLLDLIYKHWKMWMSLAIFDKLLFYRGLIWDISFRPDTTAYTLNGR